MHLSSLVWSLCVWFALGVASRSAWADSDTVHKRATLVRAGRTETYRVELPRLGSLPRVFRVISLPEFAKFDAKSGTFTFEPRPDQVGYHRAELDVSDGESTFPFTLTVTVTWNRAPAVVFQEAFLIADRADQERRFFALVSDEDDDRLSVVAQHVPKGAKLAELHSVISLDWLPTAADLGEHRLTLLVSDGLETTRVERTLIVVPRWRVGEWSTHLVPSLGTSTFFSHTGEAFAGGAFEWTLFARRNSARDGLGCRLQSYSGDCHASLLRFYVNFELLAAPRADEPALFTYAFGYSGSFESYIERRWLIPFYALEIGGVRDQSGHHAAVRPALGLHLWADHRVWLDVSVGERLVPAELSTLSGPTASLSAMLVPW